jgi:hypothetical protein
MKDIVLDTDNCLDQYCNSRVKYWAKRVVASQTPKNIVGFLAKIYADSPTLAVTGLLPGLLAALPQKKQRAVVMAGFWLDDIDGVAHVAMDISGYKCPNAERQTIEWFRSKTPSSHIL